MYKNVCKICRLCKKEGLGLVFETAGGLCVECIIKRVEKGIEERLKNDYNKEVEDVGKKV